MLGNVGWIYGKEGNWKIIADTVAQCNPEVANNRENQLIEQIKLAKYFSLQVDKCIDIPNLTILLAYVGFEHDDCKEKTAFSWFIACKHN